ncbi:MAG: hypothetical protein ACLSGB_10490 [Dorea sp.]
MGYYKTNRDFHEARWDEPIIMKLGNPGERGILVPKADEKVTKATGTVETLLPKNLIRKKAPRLSGNVSDAGTQTLYEIISGDDWNRF